MAPLTIPSCARMTAIPVSINVPPSDVPSRRRREGTRCTDSFAVRSVDRHQLPSTALNPNDQSRPFINSHMILVGQVEDSVYSDHVLAFLDAVPQRLAEFWRTRLSGFQRVRYGIRKQQIRVVRVSAECRARSGAELRFIFGDIFERGLLDRVRIRKLFCYQHRSCRQKGTFYGLPADPQEVGIQYRVRLVLKSGIPSLHQGNGWQGGRRSDRRDEDGIGATCDDLQYLPGHTSVGAVETFRCNDRQTRRLRDRLELRPEALAECIVGTNECHGLNIRFLHVLDDAADRQRVRLRRLEDP